MSPTRRIALALAVAICALPANAQERELDFGIAPEQAPKLAESTVAVVEKLAGKRLDYSPESLKVIDELVLKFKAEGNTPKSMTKTMVVFGCYVGEVMVRNLAARWDTPNDREYKVGFTSVVVRASNGAISNPIGKVFKLLQNGEEDSVVFFYRVAAERLRPSASASASASAPR